MALIQGKSKGLGSGQRFQDYARPAGICYLYEKTSLNWMGAGSADAQELFDPVIETGDLGFYSYSGAEDPLTGFQTPDLAFVKNRYLALFPTATAEDALLTDWIGGSSDGKWVDQGTWEQHRTYGPPPSQRICQVDSDPTKTFARHSLFQHAGNASFAIRIDLGSLDQNADPAQGTRFAAVAWGSLSWVIFFFNGHPPVLAENIGGNWIPRVELPHLISGTDDNPGETVIIVELIRNSLIVSTEFSPDMGTPLPDSAELIERFNDRTQHQGFYSRNDDTTEGPIGWYSGVFDVFGAGLELAIEVTPVSYPASGTYISTYAALINPRSDFPAMDVWGNANGGVVNIVNLNGGFDSFLRYQLTFFPATQAIGGRVWMRTPDVEAVRIIYPCLTIPGFPTFGDQGETLEGRILSCKLSKPAQLDQVSFTAKLYFPDGFLFASGDWRWRPIKVALGWEFAKGQAGRSAGVELVDVFAGYIVEVEAVQLDPFTIDVQMTCVSGSIRARKKRFGSSVAPRGGWTLNTALSVWMQSMGVPPSDYAWDPIGDLVVLPKGRPERPAFKPPVDGDSWGWHQELCRAHGLELAWTDAGQFITVPINTVIPFGDTWYALPVNPMNGLHSLTMRESVIDNYSRLLVSGHVPRIRDGLDRSEPDTWRYIYTAWAINFAAEQDPSYPAFRPWAELRQKPLDFGPVEPWFIDLACFTQAEYELLPRLYAAFKGEFSPLIGRRYQVNIDADGPEATGIYVVESIEHELTGSEFEAHTSITCYRIA